ncbi:MAG: putative bifunctional diguanylate cyclase/phosphodiesterase, partial [Woeseiaceae bacterium]
MKESTVHRGPAEESESIDLTRTIKKLSMPVETVNDALEEASGTALLLCRDSDSRKWGPRWLGQCGLQATVPSDPANALEIARTTVPDVIVVEAGLIGAGGAPIFQNLLDAADVRAEVIVLCNNQREIKAALDANAFDLARKPFQWQLIANRARYALLLKNKEESVEAINKALQEALALANTARERLRSQESFEPVTGLPNRGKFIDLLRRGMRASDRDGNALAVFVIGFTRFRLVIEAMGQDQADRILTQIGRNLGEILSQAANDVESSNNGLRTAAIATLDQFRFGLMMTIGNNDDALTTFQQQLFDTLSRPIQIAGQVVHLSACLGVALYPQDADDVDSLLQRADNAMRDAQSRGGGFKYYCTETDAAAARKLKLEHMLHEALDRGDLSVAYQPIVDVATGELCAAEALLRWQQPDGSYVPPEEFVAVAEESGLMIRTGEYALDSACRQFAEWRESGMPLPYICVNVAKVQLMSSGFSRTVQRILEKHALEPGDLELEISERGVLSGDYDVVTQLHELKSLGVKLSIDDFGTGDSAIAYLKDLPVDALKIDRSYVAGLADDGKEAAIASAMVALGQRLDLAVVAEGVETEEQLAVLNELGCDYYQGFLTAEA